MGAQRTQDRLVSFQGPAAVASSKGRVYLLARSSGRSTWGRKGGHRDYPSAQNCIWEDREQVMCK